MNKIVNSGILAALLTLGVSQASYAACDPNQFWIAPPPLTYASACLDGTSKVRDIEGLIEPWVSSLEGKTIDLFALAKFEADTGSEFGDLTVEPTSTTGEFDWSFSGTMAINDAVFVVKQAREWIAYSFGDITAELGGFLTDTFRRSNNYSHLSVWGSEASVVSVPEIDGKSTGIVLALLLGLVAIFRERWAVR